MRKLKEGMKRWSNQLQLTKEEKRRIKLIVMATIVLTAMMLIVDNQPLDDLVYRNTYGDGDREEQLLVRVEGENGDGEEATDETFEFEVEISEQAYSEQELVNAFAEGIEVLDILVLGENESADTVYYNLNLVTQIPNSAIEVQWSWSPYEVLDIYGEIQEEEISSEGTLVELVGTLIYEEEEVQYVRTLQVFPAPQSDIEALESKLIQLFYEANDAEKTEEWVQLPTEIEGYTLTWYGERSYRGLGILLMGIAIVALLIWKKESEQKKQLEESRKEMLHDYPQIINTFTLYIGAGMTVKNAWKRIVQEHRSERYVYAEMKRTYLEMGNGLSEVECYEQFGRRCDIRCYQRMGLLFAQNVRKGTKGLMELLEREAIEALEEQRKRVREEGEKAGTKLLMPMFLMLAVVLVIIIVPAFFSIQI